MMIIAHAQLTLEDGSQVILRANTPLNLLASAVSKEINKRRPMSCAPKDRVFTGFARGTGYFNCKWNTRAKKWGCLDLGPWWPDVEFWIEKEED